MAEPAVSVPLGTPLIEVALQMGESGTRYLLVRDENSRIAGVVSYGDVLRYMARITGDTSESWKSRPVESLMTSQFEPSCPIAGSEDVLGLVMGETVSCVPVLEDGRLVGMLTQNDLLVSWERMEPLIDAATIDEVTELSNRALFNRRIREEWERSQRNGEPLAVLLFDLDFFKQVNDQCGHLIGDTVLSEIACCLRRQFRSYDVVSRFGGDEFAVLCCDCTSESIDSPIRRLQAAVRTLTIPGNSVDRHLSLSVGAAVIDSGYKHSSVEKLIQAADRCLYRAKDDGRDCAYRIILHGADEEPMVKVQPAPETPGHESRGDRRRRSSRTDRSEDPVQPSSL